MFASDDLFDKRFEPFEDGYLYYPSKRSGGKFITLEEYQSLKRDDMKQKSAKAFWKRILVRLILAFAYAAIEVHFHPPEWAVYPAVAAILVIIGVPIFWRAYAPNRLVKGRKDSTPPRRPSEVSKAARALLPWDFVAAGLSVGTFALVLSIANEPSTVGGWMLVVGSGAVLGSYLWTAFAKFKDSRD